MFGSNGTAYGYYYLTVAFVMISLVSILISLAAKIWERVAIKRAIKHGKSLTLECKIEHIGGQKFLAFCYEYNVYNTFDMFSVCRISSLGNGRSFSKIIYLGKTGELSNSGRMYYINTKSMPWRKQSEYYRFEVFLCNKRKVN